METSRRKVNKQLRIRSSLTPVNSPSCTKTGVEQRECLVFRILVSRLVLTWCGTRFSRPTCQEAWNRSKQRYTEETLNQEYICRVHAWVTKYFLGEFPYVDTNEKSPRAGWFGTLEVLQEKVEDRRGKGSPIILIWRYSSNSSKIAAV